MPTGVYERPSDATRFWAKVNVTPGCWFWKGSLYPKGYGQFRFDGRPRGAHIFSYLIHVGQIPDGLEIDHLCRTRHCVNWMHLEAVTHRVNLLRGTGFAGTESRQTHCKRGHEFTVENTMVYKGERSCIACRNAHRHIYDQRYNTKVAGGRKLSPDHKQE